MIMHGFGHVGDELEEKTKATEGPLPRDREGFSSRFLALIESVDKANSGMIVLLRGEYFYFTIPHLSRGVWAAIELSKYAAKRECESKPNLWLTSRLELILTLVEEHVGLVADNGVCTDLLDSGVVEADPMFGAGPRSDIGIVMAALDGGALVIGDGNQVVDGSRLSRRDVEERGEIEAVEGEFDAGFDLVRPPGLVRGRALEAAERDDEVLG